MTAYTAALGQASGYAAAILAETGLQAYWQLQEASGTVATDSGPSALHGTYVGAPTLGQPGGPVGRLAAIFSGGTQKVTLPSMTVTPPYSIEGWIQLPTAFPNWSAAEAAYFWNLALGTGFGRVQLAGAGGFAGVPVSHFVGGGAWQQYAPANQANAVKLGQWYHIVGTIDAVGGMVLYVNGVQIGNSTVASPTGVTGAGQIAFGSSVAMAISDVALYTVVLTPAQVANHWRQAGDRIGGNSLLTRLTTIARPQLNNVGGQDATLNPILNPEAAAAGTPNWGWYLGGFDSGGSSTLGVADGPAGGPATSFDVTKTLSSNIGGLFTAQVGDSASGTFPTATMTARGYLRITGGQTVRCGGWVKVMAGASGAQMGLIVYWRDEQGAWIGSTTIANLGAPSGGWQWISGSAVAPANAAWTMFWAQVPLLAGAIEVRATGFVQYVNGPATIAFFDGNSPGAAWIGTANASGSLLSSLARQTSAQRAISESIQSAAQIFPNPTIQAPFTPGVAALASQTGSAVGSVNTLDTFGGSNSWDAEFTGLTIGGSSVQSYVQGTGGAPVQPGDSVLVTVAVKASGFGASNMDIRFATAGGGYSGDTGGATNVTVDGTWHTYTLRGEVSAFSNAAYTGITVNGASPTITNPYIRIALLNVYVVQHVARQATIKRAIGDAAPAAEALTRQAALVRSTLGGSANGQDGLVNYMQNPVPNAGGARAWVKSTNLSAISTVADTSSPTGFAVVLDNSTGNDNYASPNGASSTGLMTSIFGLSPGDLVTLAAWVWIDQNALNVQAANVATDTDNGQNFSLQIWYRVGATGTYPSGYQSVSTVNAGTYLYYRTSRAFWKAQSPSTWFRDSVTVTIPSGVSAIFIRLYGPGNSGTWEMRFAGITLTKTASDPGFFNPDAGSGLWVGTAEQSPSVLSSFVRATAAARALPEALSPDETLVRSLALARPLPEVLAGGDALTRSVALARAFADGGPLAETFARAVGQARAIADAAPAADALSRTWWKQLAAEGIAAVQPALLARLTADPSLIAALAARASLLATTRREPTLLASTTSGPAAEASVTTG